MTDRRIFVERSMIERVVVHCRFVRLSLSLWASVPAISRQAPTAVKTSVAAASIHDHSFADQHAVILPADLNRAGSDTRLARRRKHHALARGEDGLEAHGRAGLTLRDGGNDPEAVALNGVVSHAGDFAQVNAPTLDGAEFICVRSADRGHSKCCRRDGGMEGD